jgi:hypothetical protein
VNKSTKFGIYIFLLVKIILYFAIIISEDSIIIILQLDLILINNITFKLILILYNTTVKLLDKILLIIFGQMFNKDLPPNLKKKFNYKSLLNLFTIHLQLPNRKILKFKMFILNLIKIKVIYL